MTGLGILLVIVSCIVLPQAIAVAEEGQVHRTHAIAMHGQPKYGPDFPHFDYVNPKALKGGKVVYSAFGSFDNLNPFILKGQAASDVGKLFETLTQGSLDEAFTRYGLLAETIES